MHQSRWWLPLLVLVLLASPFAGGTAVVLAEDAAPAAAPAATVDDEIILLTSAGQIRVDDPHVPAGFTKVVWNSGADTGYTRVAGGDFNGDGDAEIVAFRGGKVKIFDPIVQPGFQPVVLDHTLDGSRVFRLLAVGDFDGDGKDEIAVTHTDFGTGVQETLKVFDGGTNGTIWTVVHQESFNALWQDMNSGDMNGDGRDDLAAVRNPEDFNPFIKIFNGATWGALAQREDNFPWFTIVLGNLSTGYTGLEAVLTRDNVLGQLDSVILFRLAGNALTNLIDNAALRFYPPFTSVAVGDLNADGDDEVIMLRDPLQNSVSLLVRNPVGATMRSFEQVIGFGNTAWSLVRSGDVDGDGFDEIVVSRYDRYRIYNDPNVNDSFTDVLGSLFVNLVDGNWPTFALANVDGGGQTSGPVLAVSPQTLSFDLEYGQASSTKFLNVSNAGAGSAFAWQATITQGSTWLQLDKASGTVPSTIGVSIKTSAVSPGTYTGTIRLSSSTAGVSGSPQDVTVSLIMRGVALNVSPKTMSFSVQYGEAPASQGLTISSVGGSSVFTWAADVLEGTDWLHLSAATGSTPSTVQVSVDPLVLAPGEHTGTIRVRALDSQVADSPQFITVVVTVADAGLVVAPNLLRLVQKLDGPVMARQVQILRPGLPVNWVSAALPAEGAQATVERITAGEAQVTAEGVLLDGVAVAPPSWLVYTPDQGTTPTTMQVSVKPGTPAGVYRAVILIVATNSNTPNRVHVVDVVGFVVQDLGFVPLLLK